MSKLNKIDVTIHITDNDSIAFGYASSKIAYLDNSEINVFHSKVKSMIINSDFRYGKFNLFPPNVSRSFRYVFDYMDHWINGSVECIMLSSIEYDYFNTGDGLIFIYKTEGQGFFVYLSKTFIKVIPTSKNTFDALDMCIIELNRIAQDDIKARVNDDICTILYESETEEELNEKLSHLYIITL